MYVLRTQHGSYVTGLYGGGGMVSNNADSVNDGALIFDSVPEIIAFFRAQPAVSRTTQNELSIHRVGQLTPALNDLGAVE